jgi:hypothetical protein
MINLELLDFRFQKTDFQLVIRFEIVIFAQEKNKLQTSNTINEYNYNYKFQFS